MGHCKCARATLAAAAAELGIPISHNSVISSSTDCLVDGREYLLPLYEGAQLPVPPVAIGGLSSCCVLHPVTNVVQERGTAGHLAVAVAIRSSTEVWFPANPQLSLLQPVFDASSLLPSAAAPRQTVISALTWALSLQAVGCLLIVNNSCE